MKLFLCCVISIFLASCAGYYTTHPVYTQGKTIYHDAKREFIWSHGKPDKTEKLSEISEKLIYYKDDLLWYGLIVHIIIIPIPLYIPIGREYETYTLENGLLSQYETTETEGEGRLCGLILLGDAGIVPDCIKLN